MRHRRFHSPQTDMQAGWVRPKSRGTVYAVYAISSLDTELSKTPHTEDAASSGHLRELAV